MSDAPKPPLLSPDGRYFWDGSRWVPTQLSPDGNYYWDGRGWAWTQRQAASQPSPTAQQLAPQAAMAAEVPAGYVIKRESHLLRNGAIGCGGLIALFILIPWCSGVLHVGGNPTASRSSPSPGRSPVVSAASESPSPAPTPSQEAPSPVAQATPPHIVKVLFNKKGSGTNKTAIFQTPGEWQLYWSYNCSNFGFKGNFIVSVYDGGSRLVDVPVNDLGMSGSNVAYEHNLSGPYYLEINSECTWQVIVKG
jgi:hypothetical protein